jgi:cell division protein FtsB
MIHLIGWMRPMALVKWTVYLMIPAVLWVILHIPTLHEYIQVRERLHNYRAEVSRLQLNQEQLQREQAALKAGGFPAEKAVRERFRLIKPGDHIIFIETDTDATSVTTSR